MTVEELYAEIEGSYDHAVRIMKKDKMISKYLLKLKSSTLCDDLDAACDPLNPERIFECAHAMKGVCGNLGLDKLADAVGELTEEFRPGSERKHTDDEVKVMMDGIRELFTKTYEGICRYEEAAE